MTRENKLKESAPCVVKGQVMKCKMQIFECKNKEIIKDRNECMEPFYKNWRGLKTLSTESFCRAILSGQNDDMLYEVGLLCLRIPRKPDE